MSRPGLYKYSLRRRPSAVWRVAVAISALLASLAVIACTFMPWVVWGDDHGQTAWEMSADGNYRYYFGGNAFSAKVEFNSLDVRAVVGPGIVLIVGLGMVVTSVVAVIDLGRHAPKARRVFGAVVAAGFVIACISTLLAIWNLLTFGSMSGPVYIGYGLAVWLMASMLVGASLLGCYLYRKTDEIPVAGP